jgi:hypothetical protein
VKTRLRAVIPFLAFLAFLLFIGIASTHGSRILDSSMAIFFLAVYVFGSAVLALRAFKSKPGDRWRILSGGRLGVMPKSWQR